MMRLAFWRRSDRGDLPPFRPLLLDQAGAAALSRLWADRAAEASGGRAPRVQKARGPSLLGRSKRLLLPVAMLAFGAFVTLGMAYGAYLSATDGDGLTRGDALRLGVIALLSLMFLGQLFEMMRMLPGAGWVAARFRRPPPAPSPLPLLDQVGAAALTRSAPEDLGALSRAGRLRSWGRRFADLGSWVMLALVAVGVTLFFAAGSALGAWSAFWQGGFGFGAAVQVAFLLLAGFGVLMLTMMGLRGLRQRRQRRRKRLLRRLLRYLLRLFDSGRRVAADASGIAGRGGATGYVRHPTSPFLRLGHLSRGEFGRAMLLTAIVAGLSFYPLFLADEDTAGATGGSTGDQLATAGGPGAGGGSGGLLVITPTPTPTPTPMPDSGEDEEEVAPPTATFTPTPIPPTATFTPTLTPIPPTATFTPTPIPCAVTPSGGELDFGDDLTALPLTLSLNDCGQAMNFVAGGSEDWIDVSPGGGTLQPGGATNLTIEIDRDGLAPGTYAEQIQLATSLGALIIPVSVEVEEPLCVATLTASPKTLNYGETESSLPLTISLNDCGDTVDFKLSVSPGGQDWIIPSPAGGEVEPGDSAGITVRILRSSMPSGPQSEELYVESDMGAITVQVTACTEAGRIPLC